MLNKHRLFGLFDAVMVMVNHVRFSLPSQEVGKTLIYMVEVVNIVQTISLNYGTITRDSPVRSDQVFLLL